MIITQHEESLRIAIEFCVTGDGPILHHKCMKPCKIIGKNPTPLKLFLPDLSNQLDKSVFLFPVSTRHKC